MKQYVFEVLEEVAKQRNRNDKVRILKENETNIFDDEIKFNIDSIIGKVFQGKFTNRSTKLLKMRRVKL